MADLKDQLQETLGDKYRVERELPGGGMSRVFIAQDTTLGRVIVIKVLHPDLSADLSLERFRREIRVAANLQHPHIVPLLAAGETFGLPYFTMPYVEGRSLRVELQQAGEYPVRKAVLLLREVACRTIPSYVDHCGLKNSLVSLIASTLQRFAITGSRLAIVG